MKKITNIITICFYITVVSVLSVKIVETVFAGSVLIGKSRIVTKLSNHKSELEQRRSDLKQQLGIATSLAVVTKTDTVNSYVPIVNPIVLEISTTVAFR